MFVNPVYSAGYCSDLPGQCLSSPFCLNQKVGSSCKIGQFKGTCKSITKQKLKTCCSCQKGKKSPINTMPTYERRIPYYNYPFPDFNHQSGDLPMGLPVERE